MSIPVLLCWPWINSRCMCKLRCELVVIHDSGTLTISYAASKLTLVLQSGTLSLRK
jgi:hypothetical protein